jgi:hypothetical protein
MHSQCAERFYAFGRAESDRFLFVLFSGWGKNLASYRREIWAERRGVFMARNAIETLLAAIKSLANKKDVPYQSLMKVFLSEKVQDELSGTDEKSRRTLLRRRS